MLESISSFGGWGVSLTRPVQKSIRLVRSLSLSRRSAVVVFVLHTQSWNLSGQTSGGESRRVLATVSSFFGNGASFTRLVLQSVSSLNGWGVSLTHPVLESVLSFVGRGVSLTRPVPVGVSSRLGREFHSHAP